MGEGVVVTERLLQEARALGLKVVQTAVTCERRAERRVQRPAVQGLDQSELCRARVQS